LTTFLFQLPTADASAGAALPPGDAARGNIGLQGPSVVMLRFTESESVRPGDSAGNLADLVTFQLTPPASVPTWTGLGRRFDPAAQDYFVADDREGRDTILTRDASLQAIIAVRAVDGGTPGIVYQRGPAGGPVSLGLQAWAEAGTAFLRLFWHDAAANLKISTATFPHTGDDDFVLVTVTRRWESTDRVVVRHYVGPALIHEATDTGAIAGATTDQTWIGDDGSGDMHFAGTLDELRVADYEISAEEVFSTYARLAHYQPAGESMLRGLLPPGLEWLAVPGTRIGNVMRVAGQALGYVMSKAEELRLTWLPDRGYRDTVARWEGIRGVAPRPRDSLDTRRARLAALFRRKKGYSYPGVRESVAPFLGLAPEDVEIREFRNLGNVDTFDGALDEERYWLRPAAANWSISSGTLRAQRSAGADLGTDPSAALVSVSGDGALAFQVKISSAPAWPDGAVVGFLLVDGATGETSRLGVVYSAPDYKLAHRLPDGTSEVLPGPALAWTPASPLWLRVYATGAPGTYRVEACTVATLDAWTGATAAGHVVAPDYAGPAVFGSDDTLAAVDVRFDDYVTRMPRGVQPFYWYVIAPPDAPDIEGARALVAKMKPAHTHAAVILGSLVCGDPNSLVGREPIGG
jgi:hypothetical protein